MAFDDFVDKFKPEKSKTPEIVGQTLDLGYKLMNVDYLSDLMTSDVLTPYLIDEKEMNLHKRGWRFQFGTSKSWAGLCDPRPESVLKSKNKNILVSIDFTKGDDNWLKNSKDVILHEIAHAIVCEMFYFDREKTRNLKEVDPEHFKLKGHGKMWETVCNSINKDGKCLRFYDNLKANDFFKRFRYYCVNCQHKEYGDSDNFAKRCIKCFKPIMIEGNI
jgi:hypothetical protein